MRKYTGIVCITVLLAACGLTRQQVNQSSEFGYATEAIGQVTGNAFVDLRNDMIDMNRHIMVLDHRKNPSNFIIEEKVPSLESVQVRVAAANAVQHYGKVVAGLANPDSSADIGDAASSLAGEVADLASQTGKPVSQEQSGALSEIISALGGLYVKHKKARALKRFVNAYQDVITSVAGLLGDDFRPEGKGFVRSYLLTAERLMNACDRVLARGRSSLANRKIAIDGCVKAEYARVRAVTLSGQVLDSVAALKAANNEMVKAMNDRHYSVNELQDYAKKVRSTVNTLKVLADRN